MPVPVLVLFFSIFPTAALLVVPPPPALAETLAEVAADCEARLGFPSGGCACIVAKWATFGENQRVYVAALARGDGAGAREVEGRMTEEQFGAAGYFMATITSAFSVC